MRISDWSSDVCSSDLEGAVTAPTRSPLGWHVVKVEGITRTAATPLAEARDEIAESLTAQKREEALGALVARIEDRLADGATLAEVAEAAGLSMRETPPITGSGVQFDNPGFKIGRAPV